MCHSGGFACQQMVLKMLPGPGYRQFADGWGSLTMPFTDKFVYIYIHIYMNKKHAHNLLKLQIFLLVSEALSMCNQITNENTDDSANIINLN